MTGGRRSNRADIAGRMGRLFHAGQCGRRSYFKRRSSPCLNLPNPYWTSLARFATIVGMYTNFPEHGSIDSNQQQWLTNEFATADKRLPLIVALHHPAYLFDVFHSGSSKMADALENAIRDTGRVPNLVLSGHVYAFQRIEKTIAPGGPRPLSGPGTKVSTICIRSIRRVELWPTTHRPNLFKKKQYGFPSL
jgi:hypothetical protein